MIELKNINLIKDGKQILNDVNLKIDSTKTTIITGPNGSGKSTLMKLIMGIEKPTNGKIFFNGLDITDFDIAKRANLQISYAMQQPVKFKGLTVRDLLKLSISKSTNEKLPTTTINEKMHNALAQVGLCPKDYIDREISSALSGGELKRIEIASVIVRNSKFIIFDEPEAGIDIWSFNKLIDLFKDLNQKLNCGVLIVSHQEKIINIADEIVVINAGKVEMQGEKDSIISKLASTGNVKVKKCKKIK